MSRLATPAELLAVAESGGGEVTREGLAEAQGTIIAMRMVNREPDELRDWRGEGVTV
jgi:hypothetical protein